MHCVIAEFIQEDVEEKGTPFSIICNCTTPLAVIR